MFPSFECHLSPVLLLACIAGPSLLAGLPDVNFASSIAWCMDGTCSANVSAPHVETGTETHAICMTSFDERLKLNFGALGV